VRRGPGRALPARRAQTRRAAEQAGGDLMLRGRSLARPGIGLRRIHWARTRVAAPAVWPVAVAVEMGNPRASGAPVPSHGIGTDTLRPADALTAHERNLKPAARCKTTSYSRSSVCGSIEPAA
jgi:hypothetical protein